MDEIELFENGNTNKFMLNVDSHSFCLLVQMAAIQIVEYCHPKSDRRIARIDRYECKPHETSFADLADRHRIFMNERHDVRTELFGQTAYLGMHSALHLVRVYVKLQNRYPEKFMVGDSHTLRQLVYTAVLSFHYWKVKIIERTIEKEGYNMGSGTGFHTIDYTEEVKGWEERYKLNPPNFKVPVLPCKRPDFEENLRKELNH